VIPSLPSSVHHPSTGPSFDALQACVPLFISSHVHIVPNVLPGSLCSWPRTSVHLLEEGHNHPILRFAYLCHMIGEELVFFSFLYIKLFELGVEIALNNRSAVTHHKIDLLKFPLRSSSFDRIDDAFVLLICFCTSRNPSSLSIDRLYSKIYTTFRGTLIATPSGRLPQKRFTKKDPGCILGQSYLQRAWRSVCPATPQTNARPFHLVLI